MKTFTSKVVDIVKKIPEGKTLTYKEIARKAGNINASRAVGMIMSKNNDLAVPCHRVIRSDGIIGEYNGLRGASKRELLIAEGFISE